MAGLDGRLQAGAMVESQQHVVDRRAVGHGRSLARSWGTELAVFPRNRGPLNCRDGEIRRANRGFRRLKCPASLCRPALPEGVCATAVPRFPTGHWGVAKW